MALAPEQATIGIRRHFTEAGVHPYDQLQWERRDARITNFRDGSVAFEQLGVEFPDTWSLNATNIVAQKYFRGTLGTEERESSLRQVIDRVADTITDWGRDGGYFVDDTEAEAFNAELKHLLVNQRAAFNSPVWFNIGVAGVPQQASACFIPRGRRLDGCDPQLVRRRGHDLQGRFRSRDQPVQGAVIPRAPQGAVARLRARSASCVARTRRPARSSRGARPGAQPRWSSSTSTIPTSRTSCGARPGRSARLECCATPASTWTSTAGTPSRSSTRTPTTRCGLPTSS